MCVSQGVRARDMNFHTPVLSSNLETLMANIRTENQERSDRIL